jgi:hypothetical protein
VTKSRALLLALVAALMASSAIRAEDDNFEVHLWPLFEQAKSPDGKHHTMMLFLFHRTTNPDGTTDSYNVLNWLQGPDYTALLPFWYRTGPKGRKHNWLVPLWFQGPDYAGAPLFLSGGWKKRDGGTTVWVTPLFHAETKADGGLENLHFVNFLLGENYWAFLPLAYYGGAPQQKYFGLIPLFFSGPCYVTVPLALSGRWIRHAGATTTWITPLFHFNYDPQGHLDSLHVLNYFYGGGNHFFFPLAWRTGPPDQRYWGFLPLWLKGPDYWCLLPLLSGWARDEGGSTTWITPLVHWSMDTKRGLTDWHALIYFHGERYDIFFPLVWSLGSDGGRKLVVFPLFFKDPGYNWAAPLALSAGWEREAGGAATWITPLFHYHSDKGGNLESLHALIYFYNRHNHFLAPLFWRTGPPDQRHWGVLPFWLHGPDYWGAPLVLSGSFKHGGGNTTWLTPLVHWSTDAKGSSTSFHVFPYFHGPRYDTVFPLWWSLGPDDARKKALLPLLYYGPDYFFLLPLVYSLGSPDQPEGRRLGVLPFYFQGQDHWSVPLFMTGSWGKRGGGRTMWVTPFFHARWGQDDRLIDLHALTYVGGWNYSERNPDGTPKTGRDYQVFFPFWFRVRDFRFGKATVSNAVLPAYFSGPGFTTIPLLLTGQWLTGDGGHTTWVTPLFHLRTTTQGEMRSLHALTYVAGKDYSERNPDGTPKTGWDYHVFFPLFYHTRDFRDGRPSTHAGFLPGVIFGPDYWTVPLVLSGRWKQQDGGTTTWITPLFHLNRDRKGAVTDWHLLNFINKQDFHLLFPLAYLFGPPGNRSFGLIPLWFHDRNSWHVPLALTGWRRHADGSDSTWVTPLFHLDHAKDGAFERMHLGIYFQGRNYQILFPFAYATGPPGKKHYGLVPLVFWGPDYWTVPLALSGGGKRRDGGSTTWITPLFHLNRDRKGTVSDWHALIYFHRSDFQFLFPLAWRTGPAGQSHWGVLPLWLSGPNYWCIPPLLSGRRADGNGSTVWLTPLFHLSRDAQGNNRNFHFLTFFHEQDLDLLLPVGWLAGPAGARHWAILPLLYFGPDYFFLLPLVYSWGRADGQQRRNLGVFPFFFKGRDYWAAPLLLSGSWRSGEDRRTTIVTPFVHVTSEKGEVRHWHAFNMVSTPEISTFFPVYWVWTGADQARHHLLFPIYGLSSRRDGDFYASVVPPLFSYHSGKNLNTSLLYQLQPFIVQRTEDGGEFNFLWWFFHVRTQRGITEVDAGFPVWLWSSQHRAGSPASWDILGGLVGRVVNFDEGHYRYRIFWIIPVGSRGHFQVAPHQNPEILLPKPVP